MGFGKFFSGLSFAFSVLVNLFIIDLPIIITLLSSVINSIRYRDNYFSCIKEKFFKTFNDFYNIFRIHGHPALIIILPIIIVFHIITLITCSGVIVKIGSVFEADEFTAKYQATVKVADTGSLPETHTLLDIDGEKIKAVVEKQKQGENYKINSIEYGNYVLINDSDKNEYSENIINNNISFSPTKIYINDKEYMTYDLDESSAYYDKSPVFEVTLSDALIEKLSSNEFSKFYFYILFSYIIFMCLFVICITCTIYKIKKSKKASIITFVTSIIISIILIILPLIYIYSNASYNVSENSVTSSQTEFGSSQTDIYEGIYLLNPDSMKIHRYDCYTIKHKENYIKTTDFESAIGNEFEPCQVCKPEDEFNGLLNLGISDAKKAEEKMNKFNEQTDKELEKRLKHIEKTNAKRTENYRKLQQQADKNFNKIQQREKKEFEKRLKHIEKTNAKRAEKYRKLQQQAEEKMNKYNESLKQ